MKQLSALVAALAMALPSHASIEPVLYKRAADVLYSPYVVVTPRAENLTSWDEETDAACKKALGGLRESTNPSGNCVCYNMPSLDCETGEFEAELRLYRISEPRGKFSDIPLENINVRMSYNGACAKQVTRENVTHAGMIGKYASIAKREAGVPDLLKSFYFVGKIDDDRMVGNMSMVRVESLILPVVTLEAKDFTGNTVQTNLSVNEASFLTGVFSTEVIMSDFSAAQFQVDDQLAGLKNGTVAFVLPGVQLMVYPIGLIIIGVWLIIFCAAYGFGTYERWQYAKVFQKHMPKTPPARR